MHNWNDDSVLSTYLFDFLSSEFSRVDPKRAKKLTGKFLAYWLRKCKDNIISRNLGEAKVKALLFRRPVGRYNDVIETTTQSGHNA